MTTIVDAFAFGGRPTALPPRCEPGKEFGPLLLWVPEYHGWTIGRWYGAGWCDDMGSIVVPTGWQLLPPAPAAPDSDPILACLATATGADADDEASDPLLGELVATTLPGLAAQIEALGTELKKTGRDRGMCGRLWQTANAGVGPNAVQPGRSGDRSAGGLRQLSETVRLLEDLLDDQDCAEQRARRAADNLPPDDDYEPTLPTVICRRIIEGIERLIAASPAAG